jgi:hypothetical protein
MAHLSDELRRAAGFVRAALVRFRLDYPEAERERYWHIRDEVIDVIAADDEHSPLGCHEPPAETAAIFEWVDAQRRAIDHRIAETPSGLLQRENLRREYKLKDEEADLLLLALLPRVHSRYRWLYAVLQHDAARGMPTVGFLAELIARGANEYTTGLHLLAATSPLASHRLVALSGTNDDALVARTVTVEDRVAGWLSSENEIDPRLAGIGSWAARSDGLRALPIPTDILNRLEMLPHLRAAEPEYVAKLRLQFAGPDPTIASRAFSYVARTLGFPTYVADTDAMLRAAAPFDLLVDIALREARLGGSAMLFSSAGGLFGDEHRERLVRLLARLEDFPRPAALDIGSANVPEGTLGGGEYMPFSIGRPTMQMRRRIWLRLLERDAQRVGDTPETASELAAAFQLTEAQIRDAYRVAQVLARRRNVFIAPVERADLFAASRALASKQLVAFAERIEPNPSLTLEQIVLPPLSLQPLLELRDRIRTYAEMPHVMGLHQPTRHGRGVLALFVGGSGTGKTMAAEALASSQHVDFFRVDLAALVSKWVGETEKNLARIFADAERTNCLLFFDEADAMFGRRGEIQEARDRWANLEVNFLLQAVERHPGVVILATNFRQNIDEAFLRRIHVVVDFPIPDPPSRKRIWSGLLPDPAHHRVTETDVAELANRFDLTGGNIRNVIVDACYRAMQTPDLTLTARHIVASVVREYQKLVRPITLGEFGQRFYDWAKADVLEPPLAPAEAVVA